MAERVLKLREECVVLEEHGQDVHNLSRRISRPCGSGMGAKCGDPRDNDGTAGGTTGMRAGSWELLAYAAAPTQTFVQKSEASTRMMEGKTSTGTIRQAGQITGRTESHLGRHT